VLTKGSSPFLETRTQSTLKVAAPLANVHQTPGA
jgi:hypothetical protein